MKVPVKHWLKQYLNYSKKDRNAVIIFSILILVGLAVYILMDYIPLNAVYDYSEQKQILEEWHKQHGEKEIINRTQILFEFNPNTISKQMLDSLSLPGFVKQNILSYRLAGGKFSTSDDVRKIYGMNDSIFDAIKDYIQIPQILKPTVVKEKPSEKTFTGFIDPNKATLDDLVSFGFTEFQASNLLEYRKKGGQINLPSDLLKIYGVDSVFFEKMEPHIQIEKITELPESKIESKQPEVLFELNSADSVSLLQLSGIGPVFASRILKYRNLLGGFNRKEQLLEVYNFSEETFQQIRNKITIDTTITHKIRLNFATYSQMLRHPYLNKKCVKSILDYRTRNGSYTSVTQIIEKGLVDSTTFKLIRPYLSCR